MPEHNIAHIITEHLYMLRYAIFINENGRLFLQMMTGSHFNAEKMAVWYVDDAMPRNTVEVWEKKAGPSESWKLYGRATLTGDGGSEFKKVQS